MIWFYNLLCRIGFHSWSNWDEPRAIKSDNPAYIKAVQYRKCQNCNKQQRYTF